MSKSKSSTDGPAGAREAAQRAEVKSLSFGVSRLGSNSGSTSYY